MIIKRSRLFINALLFIFLVFLYNNVCALNDENQFINENGVVVSQKEYEFIQEYYGDDFFERMTNDDYEWINDLNIDSSDVEIKTIYLYDNGLLDRGDTHSTPSKKLTISKVCSGNVCSVLTKLQWLVNPSVRSFDLIGVRLYNTSFSNNTVVTKITSSAGTEYSYNHKVSTVGAGTSVDLPDSATNIVVEQKVYVYTGGVVYGSYQHATSNISLLNSQKYYFDANGYGGVFLFYDGIGSYYDAMSGVDIYL